MTHGPRVPDTPANPAWETVERLLDFLVDRDPDLFFWQEFEDRHGISRTRAEQDFQAWSGSSVREFTDNLRPAELRRGLVHPTPKMSGGSVFTIETRAELPADTLNFAVLDTIYGPAFFAGAGEYLLQLEFLPRPGETREWERIRAEFGHVRFVEEQLPVFALAQEVINGMGLGGPGVQTALPLLLVGTPFQLAVWKQLLEIPKGSLTTYGALAESHGGKRKARALGQAVGANRLAGLVPCHRIVARDGTIGHFRWGTARKKAMIGRERLTVGPE